MRDARCRSALLAANHANHIDVAQLLIRRDAETVPRTRGPLPRTAFAADGGLDEAANEGDHQYPSPEALHHSFMMQIREESLTRSAQPLDPANQG
jgi:hypothetical protein